MVESVNSGNAFLANLISEAQQTQRLEQKQQEAKRLENDITQNKIKQATQEQQGQSRIKERSVEESGNNVEFVPNTQPRQQSTNATTSSDNRNEQLTQNTQTDRIELEQRQESQRLTSFEESERSLSSLRGDVIRIPTEDQARVFNREEEPGITQTIEEKANSTTDIEPIAEETEDDGRRSDIRELDFSSTSNVVEDSTATTAPTNQDDSIERVSRREEIETITNTVPGQVGNLLDFSA